MPELNFAQIFIGFLVLLFSLTVHESAHAWTAYRLGDPTGKLLGRISLNPAAHVDPVGTILFPLIASLTRLPLIGWAKPVPVDILKLRNYRRDYPLVAAAGPAANVLLAVVGGIGYRVVAAIPSGGIDVNGPLAVLTIEMLQLNVLLAIFNLLPVPPLDGATVLAGLLPDGAARVFDHVRPYGFLILYALIFTGVISRLVGLTNTLLQLWLL